MILKDKSTKFNIELEKTNKKEGLSSKDFWYLSHIDINNNEINLQTNYLLFTKNELKDFLKKTDIFLKSKKAYKERIVFIKNFFKIFLISNRKHERIMIIEIIHINNTQKNINMILSQDEIIELITKLKDYEH